MMIGTGRRCEWRLNYPGILPQHLCIREDKGNISAAIVHGHARLDQVAMVKGETYSLQAGQTINIGAIQIQLSLHADGLLAVPLSIPIAKLKRTEYPLLRSRSEEYNLPATTSCRWLTGRWQIAVLSLCLMLPLATLATMLALGNGSSQIPPQLNAATVTAPPVATQKTSTAAAEQLVLSDSRQASSNHRNPTGKAQGITSRITSQAEQIDRPALVIPGDNATSIDQKPYGLASPVQRAKYYSSTIRAAADLHNLDPALVKAVIHAESAFNPFAVSHAGAQGLMQIMPATAKELALADPFHPGNNVLSGSQLLRRLLDKYQQDETLALAAYNAGEYAVKKYQGVPPFAETKNYIEKVTRLRLQYQLESYKQITASSH